MVCTSELLSNLYSTPTSLPFCVRKKVTLTEASGIGFLGVGMLNSVRKLEFKKDEWDYVEQPPFLSKRCTVFFWYFWVHLSTIPAIVASPCVGETDIVYTELYF
jgi:hypothetical protein